MILDIFFFLLDGITRYFAKELNFPFSEKQSLIYSEALQSSPLLFLQMHLGKEKVTKIGVLFFSERGSSGASDKNTKISIHSALWEERIFIDPITMQGGCQITDGSGKVQLNLRKANGSLTKLIVQGSNSRTSTQGNKQRTKTCRLKKERVKEQTKNKNKPAQVPWQLLQFFITFVVYVQLFENNLAIKKITHSFSLHMKYVNIYLRIIFFKVTLWTF